ncbi:MAG: tetratricopeptide repeat protein [Endozoicomonas sp. (ex Botrylloides leachii)]|nr:tetratricopeptide repeat protein [Endozoicomonas sp. (ex Botrylloides leachii)]
MSYNTDEEQVEQLKHLWKSYGQPILVSILIILVGFFGYKAWQNSQRETAAAASKLYQDVLDTLSNQSESNKEDEATIKHVVGILQKDYSSSRYAALATLFLAQQQVEAGQLKKAISSFHWILAQKPDASVDTVVRVRLARVLLALPEPEAQKALDELSAIKIDKSSFVISIESAKGDAYLALGQKDKASEAYQEALNAARKEGQPRPLLQLKLDDLTAVPKGD